MKYTNSVSECRNSGKGCAAVVGGIQYYKDGTWYGMSQWVEEEETVSERLIPVENSIYDILWCSRSPEREVAEKLKKMKNVRLLSSCRIGSKWDSGGAVQTGLGLGDGRGFWG